jgi:predicted Zn-dependent peptidase
LATAPEDTARAALVAVQAIRDLAAVGPTAEELARHAQQLQAGVWMELEGPEARMLRLGRWAVSGEEWLTPGAVAARLRAVRPAHVRAFAQRLGDPAGWAAAYLGPAGAEPGPWSWMEA